MKLIILWASPQAPQNMKLIILYTSPGCAQLSFAELISLGIPPILISITISPSDLVDYSSYCLKISRPQSTHFQAGSSSDTQQPPKTMRPLLRSSKSCLLSAGIPYNIFAILLESQLGHICGFRLKRFITPPTTAGRWLPSILRFAAGPG